MFCFCVFPWRVLLLLCDVICFSVCFLFACFVFVCVCVLCSVCGCYLFLFGVWFVLLLFFCVVAFVRVWFK